MLENPAYNLPRLDRLRLRPSPYRRENASLAGDRTSIRLEIARAASLVRHCALEVYSVDGTIDDMSIRLKVLDDGTTLPYISHLVSGKAVRTGRAPAVSGFDTDTGDADILVVGANVILAAMYAARGFTLIPKWIRLFLPINGHPDLMLDHRDRDTRKYFRRLIRSIEENEYSAELVTDPRWIDCFYNEMYVPYAVEKYGPLAVVHSYTHVRRRFSHGGGIVVKQRGEPVGGAILCPRGDALWVPHMGVLGGSARIARRGMTMAMDYFIVELAHRLGYNAINYGHARPFLSDGVLRYKLTWHMEVRDDDDAMSLFALKFAPGSEAAQRFLSANPFYALDRGVPARFSP